MIVADLGEYAGLQQARENSPSLRCAHDIPGRAESQ